MVMWRQHLRYRLHRSDVAMQAYTLERLYYQENLTHLLHFLDIFFYQIFWQTKLVGCHKLNFLIMKTQKVRFMRLDFLQVPIAFWQVRKQTTCTRKMLSYFRGSLTFSFVPRETLSRSEETLSSKSLTQSSTSAITFEHERASRT